MTELVLHIENLQLVEKLLPVLKQLDIPYTSRYVVKKKKKTSKPRTDIIAKIEAGGMDIQNFDELMRDFEESRKDRTLLGRD